MQAQKDAEALLYPFSASALEGEWGLGTGDCSGKFRLPSVFETRTIHLLPSRFNDYSILSAGAVVLLAIFTTNDVVNFSFKHRRL